MARTYTPNVLVTDGFLLALNGGFGNMVVFLGIFTATTSHMSGNARTLSASLVDLEWSAAISAALLIISFMIGAALSGYFVPGRELDLTGKPYGRILFLVGLFLLLSGVLLVSEIEWGIYFAAAAFGLQNGMATFYREAVIRTTHVSGIATDLGVDLGRLVRNEPVPSDAFWVRAALLGGFTIGGLMGALAFKVVGVGAILFAGVYAILLDLMFVAWVRRQTADAG